MQLKDRLVSAMMMAAVLGGAAVMLGGAVALSQWAAPPVPGCEAMRGSVEALFAPSLAPECRSGYGLADLLQR